MHRRVRLSPSQRMWLLGRRIARAASGVADAFAHAAALISDALTAFSRDA